MNNIIYDGVVFTLWIRQWEIGYKTLKLFKSMALTTSMMYKNQLQN